MTPEFDSKATYEACAPLHWDAEEWDFWAWSYDDKSLTDSEDLGLRSSALGRRGVGLLGLVV
jgi:hypothetical protein